MPQLGHMYKSAGMQMDPSLAAQGVGDQGGRGGQGQGQAPEHPADKPQNFMDYHDALMAHWKVYARKNPNNPNVQATIRCMTARIEQVAALRGPFTKGQGPGAAGPQRHPGATDSSGRAGPPAKSGTPSGMPAGLNTTPPPGSSIGSPPAAGGGTACDVIRVGKD